MTHKSKKGFTLVEIMIVVVIIGLLAAMAIPAFNKVRENAREKAIVNNLRQIASAGQQYVLDEGVSSVAYATLSGDYFTDITPVAGETYDNVSTKIFEAGGSITVTTSGGDTIYYTY